MLNVQVPSPMNNVPQNDTSNASRDGVENGEWVGNFKWLLKLKRSLNDLIVSNLVINYLVTFYLFLMQ